MIDFSLVLATIVTSLTNYLKLSPSSDIDMIDVLGDGDAHEEELDEKAIEKQPEVSSAPLMTTPIVLAAKPDGSSEQARNGKKAVMDSWEDDLDDDDDDNDELVRSMSNKPPKDKQKDIESKFTAHQEDNEAFDMSGGEKGEGILNVLKAFRLLQAEFNGKFKAMWA